MSKRRAAQEVAKRGFCSLRRACFYVGISWSSYCYKHGEVDEKSKRLVKRIVELSLKHSRYGYRRIRALLVKEGWEVSKKLVQKVRRVEGLKVEGAKKKRIRRGYSTGLATKARRANEVWSWDFVHDRTERGGKLKMMTLIDEYTRECLAIRVERELKSEEVLEVLKEAIWQNGVPDYIRSDNGSEFIAHLVQEWLGEQKIKTLYIDPGSPWQNGYVESFHQRLRDECLNREWLLSLGEAKVVIEEWRKHYNEKHPHSRLGFLSPGEFARKVRDLAKDFVTPTAALRPLLGIN